MRMLLHNQLLEIIHRLERFDSSLGDINAWSIGEPFIQFIQSNNLSSRLVLIAVSKHQFLYTLIVDNKKLENLDQSDLLRWNMSIPGGFAGYCFTYGDPDSFRLGVGIEHSGTQTLENSTPLVISRSFDGLLGSNKNYYEINQIFVHASDLHWLPDRKAFCKIDRLGDIVEVININQGKIFEGHTNLVTCEPDVLEDFLVATNSSLVRLFDFRLPDSEEICSESDMGERVAISEFPDIFYEKIQGVDNMSFLRGVQIIRLHSPRKSILRKTMREGSYEKIEYVEFIASDWRHSCVKLISTDPNMTCNYFNSHENDHPYELSPAFFRAEVLSKYKSDPDKYSLSEGYLNCRNAWTLRGIDVNAYGQVHAYICDLAKIPYEEQLYWKSFNESPKGGISERAIRNDFLAQWYSSSRPFDELNSTLRRWETDKVGWWRRSNTKKYTGFEFPLTDNQTDWAKHFLELAKLVIEGFRLTYIKEFLLRNNISFPDEEANHSIALLEKTINVESTPEIFVRLSGLRDVQNFRTKLYAHAGGNEALEITKTKLIEFGSFEAHFQSVCKMVNNELVMIEGKFNKTGEAGCK